MNTTFNLEDRMRKGINYLQGMTDDITCQPYFTVFCEDPALAIHDWPDFGDLTARFMESAILAEEMTGDVVPNEKALKTLCMSYLDAKTGLSYRPSTLYSHELAEIFDQSRTLCGLCTWYMQESSKEVATCMRNMIDGLLRISENHGEYISFRSGVYNRQEHAITNGTPIPYGSIYFGGVLLRPLIKAYELMDYAPALELAEGLISWILGHSSSFSRYGEFQGHSHSCLATAAGIAAYAVLMKNKNLLQEAWKIYAFARSCSTEFGFVPEFVWLDADIIASETCSIVDYLDLALVLAKAGYTECWEDIERTAKNQLVESQFTSTRWLVEDNSTEGNDLYFYKDVAKRLVGGFAGWSSPAGLLAYKAGHNQAWSKTSEAAKIYAGRPRAVQNCCGPAGLKGLYLVWSNIVVTQGDTTWVNMHIDRSTSVVQVTSYQPYMGKTEIRVNSKTHLLVRLPSSVSIDDVGITLNGVSLQFKAIKGYLDVGIVSAGTSIMITYPLREKLETCRIGNPGHAEFSFDMEWVGDFVISSCPHESNVERGKGVFGEVEMCMAPSSVVHPIYHRDHMVKELPVKSCNHIRDCMIMW